MTPTVRLVCWKPDQARERARELEEAGYRVDASPLNPSGLIGHFRANPPSVVVIDLERLPSQGREVGVALRQSPSTRRIPIVFAGGLPEKVERIRQELPDAVYTAWPKAAGALKAALKRAPIEPVQPPAHMERYTGSSLVKKLGFVADTEAAIVAAPDDFKETLGDLPDGVELRSRLTGKTKLAIWFVRSRQELEAAAEHLGTRLPEGGSVWIVHPKQTGRYRVDFNQNDVRSAGLAVGLVDYKVCAVDADWSGLKFARRRG
jgi:CheY-like chemotaxis protein